MPASLPLSPFRQTLRFGRRRIPGRLQGAGLRPAPGRRTSNNRRAALA